MQTLLAKSSVAAPFTAGPVRAQGRSRVSQRLVVRAVAEAEAPSKERKLGPLQRGGTLSGEQAAGKDAGDKAKAMMGQAPTVTMQIIDERFADSRWVNGRWDYNQFKASDGEVDWDKVIDAEIARRKLLEESPIACRNDDLVNFDTAEVPWWAWVKRFHLPEAEKLNGRAAMVGYVLAGFVDLLTGHGLVDQQESFFGKLILHITVFGILLVRSNADLDNYKNLIDEATFYDKQWNATWEGVRRPSESSEQ